MAALTKKNTLKQTGFEVNNLGFKYRDKYYKFDDVIGVKILRHVLEHKVILVGSEFHYSISIMILVKSGDHIQVTEQPTWLSNSKISSVEHIENQFSIIAQKSWNNRISKYTEQVKSNGYYEYDGWCFYPKQRQIKHLAKGKIYDLNSITLLKTPTYIVVEEKNEGIGSKFIRNMIGKEIAIGTLVDPDVFFTLLKHFFNLSWANSDSSQLGSRTTLP